MLHDELGTLTTNADPAGATLPAGPGGLRQVLPGSTLERLFSAHVEGIEFLRARGLAVRGVSAETFREDPCGSMARQRAVFLSSPLRAALITLWRAVTQRVPFVGALRAQRIAEVQIGRLLAGARRGCF